MNKVSFNNVVISHSKRTLVPLEEQTWLCAPCSLRVCVVEKSFLKFFWGENSWQHCSCAPQGTLTEVVPWGALTLGVHCFVLCWSTNSHLSLSKLTWVVSFTSLSNHLLWQKHLHSHPQKCVFCPWDVVEQLSYDQWSLSCAAACNCAVALLTASCALQLLPVHTSIPAK